MDFGIAYFPTHDGIAPGPLARLVEEHGQESLFFAEHTHIPAARATARAGGDAMPQKYWHCYDLFVALTAAATATSRLRVGSGVCVVTQRDPIITANAVASVDRLSGGRFDFGVGAGWNVEELRNHGVDPQRRMALMKEHIEAMLAIWTQEEASYAGEHVAFDRIWSHPKPARRPAPPILVGGAGPTVFDRVLAYGDAWFPSHPATRDLYERIAELHARAERHVEVHAIDVPADPAELERLRDAGVRRCLHFVPSGGRSVVERGLERWEAAIAALTGG